MTFIENRYTKYKIANQNIHVLMDAPHATPPRMDAKTGEIANNVSTIADCNCIIGIVSRNEADLNRPPINGENQNAVFEYRRTIQNILIKHELLSEDGLLVSPFLHLQIHGMKDRSLDPRNAYELDIEIGTRFTDTCSPSVEKWLLSLANDWAKSVKAHKNVIIGANKYFRGDRTKSYHRHGDGNSYKGYGENFHTLQIEFSNWLRTKHQSAIEKLLCSFVISFENNIDSFA